MSEYGIIVKDTSGNVCKLTPELGSVVGSGTETMPDSLVDTDKYYVSFDLPGSYNVDVSDLGVILNAFLLNANLHAYSLDSAGHYFLSWYAHDGYDHYEHAMSTGVMTSWTPGDFSDYTDVNDMDPIVCINPAVHWEKMGASTVTSVKMFAAMRYDVYDGSGSAYKEVYQIGSDGVEKVDYAAVLKGREAE